MGVLVLACATLFLWKDSIYGRIAGHKGNGVEYIVVITPDGFSPKELYLNVGDRVKFTTTLTRPFWPASDLHPSHTLYPEFDPKNPVNPTDSWSFVFLKVGTWKYHDHLFPLDRGTITVNGKASKTIVKNNCPDNQSKPECWGDFLATIGREKGIDVAFDALAELYEKEPTFASNCHQYAHEIGQVAYEQFNAGNPPPFTEKAS